MVLITLHIDFTVIDDVWSTCFPTVKTSVHFQFRCFRRKRRPFETVASEEFLISEILRLNMLQIYVCERHVRFLVRNLKKNH